MPSYIGDLETLAATVRRSTRQEALNEAAEAQREAERIRAEAREERRRLREQIVARAQAQVDEAQRHRTAQQALTEQRDYLAAREVLLARVWDAAERRLHDLPSQPEYADVLRRLAFLAAETLGGGTLSLAADPRGHELLTETRLAAWSAHASAAHDTPITFERATAPADTWGGLRATHADGRRMVDATFATRLALARDNLRRDIFEILTE